MKTYIEHLATVTIILLAVSFSANAKELQFVNKSSLRKTGLEMLKMDLRRHRDPGVVEGALYATIECKGRYPDLHYSRLLRAVNRVANQNDNASIGYMAQLTSMYLQHSSEFRLRVNPAAQNYNYLFKQIANQLEHKLLVSLSEKSAR